MADYIIQKPRELDATSVAFQKEVGGDLKNLISTHIAQRKYDGCALAVRLWPDGEAEVLSATGEQVLSCDHIGRALHRIYGPGWVIFGEAWRDGYPFPKISGLVRQHDPAPDLRFVVYDIVPYGSFAIGLHDVPYRVRFAHLQQRLDHSQFPDSPIELVAYYPPGTYADPQEGANKWVQRGGYDGLILRHPEHHWYKGYVKDGSFIKVKPVISLDLRCIGVEEGKGKMAGMAGKLVLSYKGKEVRASGGDFDLRREWFASPPIGKIFEVEALGVTEDGLLREPRLKGQRHDKVKADDE